LRHKKGGRPEVNNGRAEEKEGYHSQPFQRVLDIRKFEEDGPVRDTLVVKHEADAPDNRGEADVLYAGQVVQNDLRCGLGGHLGATLHYDLNEEVEGKV
jgi:hypothetical protein